MNISLPIKFHINIWPSMLRELAGRVDMKFLPASAQIQSARLSTTSQECPKARSNQFDSEDEKISEFEKVELF